MASQKGPIRVVHFGLGPIGAAVVRQVAARKGFKIVGAVDIDPAKVGRDLGEVAGVGRQLKVKVSDDAKKTIKAGEAGRRRAVHELVDEVGAAADRGDPQAEGADRLDDRGARLSDQGPTCATRGAIHRWRRRPRWPFWAPA